MNTQTTTRGRSRSRSGAPRARSSQTVADTTQTTHQTSQQTSPSPGTSKTQTANPTNPTKSDKNDKNDKGRRSRSSDKPEKRGKSTNSPTSVRPGIAGGGVFRTHARGFGFVDLDAPDAPDGAGDRTPMVPDSCFVPPPLTAGLLSGDRVSVTYELEDDGRATATRVTLADRTRTTVFGVVEEAGEHRGGPGTLLLRVDPHVATGKWRLADADQLRPGQAVLAELTTGTRSARPVVVFEDPTSGDAIRARILDRHEIVADYPQVVLDQAAASVAVTEAADTAAGRRAGLSPTDTSVPRRDLRDLVTFTIDADSSRDLDDALSVYPAAADGSVRVCVHIADVAAHVPEGSPIDSEARRAATSVYLPGWTRPMLPPTLSEDALSLLPGLERDALTVEMRVMPDGQVTAVDVYASRITSNTRLSYDTAADILAGARPGTVSDEVVDALRWLRTAGARLGIQRARRGGVEARRVEPELAIAVVDNVATQVDAAQSNPAHLLIERLMVATNEAVDAWMSDRGLTTLHRAHGTPGPEVTAKLEAFCSGAGYHPGFGEHLTPLGLAALAEQLEGADEETSAVWDVLLANLGRAFYTPQQLGHFGLASSGYLHFTSPIRRYADLCVHRTIRAYLAGQRHPGDYTDVAALETLAVHINDAAGVAARAEAQMRKALWMVTLAGDPRAVLSGRVSGVNAKGVFVTIDNSHVSGFVPARDLSGRGWAQADDGLALVDATGRRIGFGDQMRVRVTSADVESGQLELAPADGRRSERSTGAARPSRARRAGR